jgi:hypothetical protein
MGRNPREWDYTVCQAGPGVWHLSRPPREGEERPVTRTVTNAPDGWRCTCPAGQFRKLCSHVKHIQEKFEMSEVLRRVQEALAEPFDAAVIGWKPQSVSGNRCMAIAYVDARDVMDRLDEVVGIDGWHDAYESHPDGNVVCRLSVLLGDQFITKSDVGGPSDQKDMGDQRKSAFSDALKRAAVKFGIGRYIYRLEPQWVDYDPQKRQIVNVPKLPPWALPKKPPADMKAVKARVEAKDKALADEGRSLLGDLVKHVLDAGRHNGHGEDMLKWPAGVGLQIATEAVREFEANRPAKKAPVSV